MNSDQRSNVPTLNDRFMAFMASRPDAESIDNMDSNGSSGRRKADFLLRGRSIIAEVKSLETDPEHKIESIIDRYRDRPDFPLFYGEVELKKVLAHLHDGDNIYAKIVEAILKTVTRNVRSAEEQTTSTREDLGLPDSTASGLILLNEDVGILDPYIAAHRVVNLIRRTRSGRSTTRLLDFAYLIFESHSLRLVSGVPAVTCMQLTGNRDAELSWLSPYLSSLTQEWATFNQGIAIDSTVNPVEAKFIRASEIARPQPTHLPRHEVWRLQYRSKPYMRDLPDDVFMGRLATLLGHSRKLMTTKPAAPAEIDLGFLERLTHGFEEAAHRGTDFKKLPIVEV